jgi:hypothetical protein
MLRVCVGPGVSAPTAPQSPPGVPGDSFVTGRRLLFPPLVPRSGAARPTGPSGFCRAGSFLAAQQKPARPLRRASMPPAYSPHRGIRAAVAACAACGSAPSCRLRGSRAGCARPAAFRRERAGFCVRIASPPAQPLRGLVACGLRLAALAAAWGAPTGPLCAPRAAIPKQRSAFSVARGGSAKSAEAFLQTPRGSAESAEAERSAGEQRRRPALALQGKGEKENHVATTWPTRSPRRRTGPTPAAVDQARYVLPGHNP